MLKYFFDLCLTFEGRRAEKAQPAPFPELEAQLQVLQQLVKIGVSPELEEGEPPEQTGLGQAASPGLDAFQKKAMERGHPRLGNGFPSLKRFFLEPVHHPGDINAVGTPGGASLTGGADPDGAAAQNLIFLAQQGQADHPVGQEVHGEGQGTAPGAFPALIAGRDHQMFGCQPFLQGERGLREFSGVF
jgi:hypothetical protein